MSKKKEKKEWLTPSTQLSFETSYAYWVEIKKNLEFAHDQIEKEVRRLSELMPDSETYWTMNSRLDDAKRVLDDVSEFLEPYYSQALNQILGRDDL